MIRGATAPSPDDVTAPAPESVRVRIRHLVDAIGDADEPRVEQFVLEVSRSRRWLAPLAFIVGSFAMLFEGLKLVVTNWRLTLVQVLPAMWIWAAMLDLKVHVLGGNSFASIRGLAAVAAVLVIAAITTLTFLLNAVFAFAITVPGPPDIRNTFGRAWVHRGAALGWGGSIGLALGVSTIVVTRWGEWWFALSLSIVIGLMMLTYVAVPARMVGMKRKPMSRHKLATSAVAGAVGVVVCTPPYMLARLGLLMLQSDKLLVLGIMLLAFGFTLQAGATGSVKAIKMSAALAMGSAAPADEHPSPGDAPLAAE